MTHVKPITVGTNYCLQLTLFAYIRNIDEHIITEPGKCIETFFFSLKTVRKQWVGSLIPLNQLAEGYFPRCLPLGCADLQLLTSFLGASLCGEWLRVAVPHFEHRSGDQSSSIPTNTHQRSLHPN